MSYFKKTSLILLSISLMSIFALSANSAIPNQINYQGRLTDNTGSPVPDGPYDISFSIYNDLNIMQWSETQNDVLVINGIFNVLIPSNPGNYPFPTSLFNEDLLLGIRVGSDDEMTPRQPLTSVPFAFTAENADALDGHAVSHFAESVHSHGGEDITGGIVDESVIDDAIARDAELAWDNLINIPADIADGDQGLTIETDPTITEPSIKDGVTWIEISSRPAGLDDGDQIGITSETDPQVGNNSLNYVPIWNGSALASGTLFDNGNVGVGTTAPSQKLEVVGNVKITGALNVEGYLRNYQLINLDPTLGLGWEQFIDYGGIALGSQDGTNRQMFMFADGAGSDNIFTAATSRDGGITWYPNFVIEQDGRIGIGTSKPATSLSNSPKPTSDSISLTSLDGINWQIENEGYALGIQNSAGGGDGLLVKAGNNAGTGATVAHFVSDNQSLLYVREDGNIGIGTTTPSTNLDIAGNLYVQGDITQPLRTEWYAIPPAAFIPMDDDRDYSTSGGTQLSSNDAHGYFVAPVFLPHGVTVTRISCFWDDNSDQQATLYLRRNERDPGGGSPDNLAILFSANDQRLEAEDSIAYAVIDNQYYNYMITLYLNIDITFFNARITYTYTANH